VTISPAGSYIPITTPVVDYCYYERLRDFSGGMNSIIINGNTSNPTIVTIAPSDTGFQSQGCGTWTKLE